MNAKDAQRYILQARSRIDRSIDLWNKSAGIRKMPSVKLLDAILAADQSMSMAALALSDLTKDHSFVDRHNERKNAGVTRL